MIFSYLRDCYEEIWMSTSDEGHYCFIIFSAVATHASFYMKQHNFQVKTHITRACNWWQQQEKSITIPTVTFTFILLWQDNTITLVYHLIFVNVFLTAPYESDFSSSFSWASETPAVNYAVISLAGGLFKYLEGYYGVVTGNRQCL